MFDSDYVQREAAINKHEINRIKKNIYNVRLIITSME